MFRPPKTVSLTLNLAPMVDVMMCLIIFFLLTAKLVQAERFPVTLPFATAAQEVENARLGSRVVINVRTAADADTAEYVVADWDGERIVERVIPTSDVPQLLTARAEQARRAGQDLRCVIRADREVKYQHVEVVLRGCGLAQISDIVFAAKKGTEAEPAR